MPASRLSDRFVKCPSYLRVKIEERSSNHYHITNRLCIIFPPPPNYIGDTTLIWTFCFNFANARIHIHLLIHKTYIRKCVNNVKTTKKKDLLLRWI